MRNYFHQLIGVIINVLAAHLIIYATFEIKAVSLLAILLLLLGLGLMSFGIYQITDGAKKNKTEIIIIPFLILCFSISFIKISTLGEMLGLLFAMATTVIAFAIITFNKIISHEPQT